MVSFFNNVLDTFFYQQRERLVLWIPVGIGLGILGYFSFMPYHLSWIFLGGMLLLSLSLSFFFSTFFKARILFISMLCLTLGFIASQVRHFYATTPVLKTSLEKPIWVRGTIEEITQGATHKKIVMKIRSIQHVVKNPPGKVSLIYRAKKEKEKTLHPGDFVVLKAKLDPLQGPLVPNGYNFQRQAKFKQIGAQGYVVYIHSILSPQKTGWFEKLERIRLSLTHHLLDKIPGQEGAIAAALITGDTGSLSKSTRADFANSGTAHILAISGLHLTLIGGLILAATRLLIGFCPPLILRIPARKIAAILALIGALIYLYISGCRVPTQRAFISFSLMMIAILLNRNPISLRLVAVAATLILLISPEVLFTPSFQLSFAAVTALVATYEIVQLKTQQTSLLKKIILYGGGILFSSMIASMTTLPFTLYHFYKFTLQSIGSNLLMIPLLSLWVMPLCLAFIGLSGWPLGQKVCAFLLKKGLTLMIHIAHTFSELPGSLIFIPGFSTTSFILIVTGGLFLCLIIGRIRLAGFGLIVIGILYTALFPKPIPFLFIAEEGKNIGIVQKDHLFVSSPRTNSFLATVWAGYAGIRPDHIHRLKKKKPDSLMPPTDFYGKNLLLSIKGVTIGYIRQPEEWPWQKKASILILPHSNHTTHDSLSFTQEDLSQSSWVVYRKEKTLEKISCH